MKKIIIVFSIILGLCWLGGCSLPLQYVAGQLEPKADMSSERYMLNLLKRADRKLLKAEETQVAAKAICSLRNLKENLDSKPYVKNAKKFCKVEKSDQIYFFYDCLGCSGTTDKGTSYILVRSGKPIAQSSIDSEYSKELRRSIPIVERLH